MKARGRFLALIAVLALTVPGCKSRPGGKPSPTAPPSVPSYVDRIPAFCKELDRTIPRLGWKLATCGGIAWKSESVSVEGRPLMWAEFGDPSSTNKTLILSMVHPDEVTPLYLGFKVVHWLKEHEATLKDSHVIVAPFVNPDGYFRKPPIRMNARGVDVNRNFPTGDWGAKAVQVWKSKLKSNPRRFPGWEASSEPETDFQENLIARFQPKKILSVHSPLNMMDYDGPSALSVDQFSREYVAECLKLRNRLRANSSGFFPGSLGNYAGQERGIPTITLELPTSNPRKADSYWKKFQPGIASMVEFKLKEDVARAEKTRPASRKVSP